MTDASATLQKEFDASPASTRDDPRKCGGCARGETETRSLTSEEPGPSRRVREERSRKSEERPRSRSGDHGRHCTPCGHHRRFDAVRVSPDRSTTALVSRHAWTRPTAARPLSTRVDARSGRQRVLAVGGGVAHPSQRRPLRDVSVWFRLTFSILPLMLSEISSSMLSPCCHRAARAPAGRRGGPRRDVRAPRQNRTRSPPRRAAAHLLSRCAARRDARALLTSHTCSGSGGGSRCVRCR